MTGLRVLLLGANGQVGTELRRAFTGNELIALDRTGADFTKPESLRAVVRVARPDVVLNAAAYTAVDKAESEPEIADRVNHLSVGVLADEAERAGALLVHYSTDYVFDGTKETPWDETDEPNPLSVYGTTKLAGERAIAAKCERHLILRTSWVYSAHGHNFLRTMLRLGRERDALRVVDDQWGAPTTAGALADVTAKLVEQVVLTGIANYLSGPQNWAGVYHATCGGQTTWCRFAREIFALAQKEMDGTLAKVEAITTEDYPTPARRPKNSVLSNMHLKTHFGCELPDWRKALHEEWKAMTVRA